jgi:hypothetical protein
MLEYGNKSPIGSKCLLGDVLFSVNIISDVARQERLLQGLMREIVRMTAQKQPLEVGIPLYHFSHASLWGNNNKSSGSDGTPTTAAPLPVSPEQRPASSHSVSTKGMSPPIMTHRGSVSSAWPSPTVEEDILATNRPFAH